VIDTIDTAYIGEQGLEEIVEKAPDILHRIRYIEEKKIMQVFLYEIGHDTGLATYGESEVKRALGSGIVKTLILSEGLEIERVTIKCTACDYSGEETMNSKAITNFELSLRGQPCPKCGSPALFVEETRSLIDDLADLAEKAAAEVEVISDQTEEGQMLKKSFGGIAATLRFKLSG
jgi:peptide chain release factor subunit 1